MQEQVQRIGRRLDELGLVLVEGTSFVVTCVNEQGPSPHLVGHAHRTPDRIDQEAPAESTVAFGDVDSEAC